MVVDLVSELRVLSTKEFFINTLRAIFPTIVM